MYYVSKRLLDVETKYAKLEKIDLAHVIASRKLRPYFYAHSIEVLTNFLLSQVLQKPEALGRLLKWAIKLGQFNVNYRPRKVIKGQALADFIVKFTYADTTEVVPRQQKWSRWEKRTLNNGSSTWTVPPTRTDPRLR